MEKRKTEFYPVVLLGLVTNENDFDTVFFCLAPKSPRVHPSSLSSPPPRVDQEFDLRWSHMAMTIEG